MSNLWHVLFVMLQAQVKLITLNKSFIIYVLLYALTVIEALLWAGMARNEHGLYEKSHHNKR